MRGRRDEDEVRLSRRVEGWVDGWVEGQGFNGGLCWPCCIFAVGNLWHMVKIAKPLAIPLHPAGDAHECGAIG